MITARLALSARRTRQQSHQPEAARGQDETRAGSPTGVAVSTRRRLMTDTTIGDHGARTSSTRLDERTRALKERIYASFTGLAILAAVSATGHATCAQVLLSVTIGVLGISAAGLLAEIIAHQLAHQRLPAVGELHTMGRIALGASGSASAPVIVLALAWAGMISLEWALWIAMALYAATLVAVMLVAAHRTGLRPIQRLLSSAMLLGLALVVVALLRLAHLH
jgi:hypothetical protein